MKTYKTLISERTLKVSEKNTTFKKAKIRVSRDAADYIRQFYYDDIEIFESVFILLINMSNNVIGFAKISQGGINSSIVDVKIIAKYAIDTLATGIILAHNHPTGNIQPSENDITITKKVKDTLDIFGCQLLDHIIITNDKDRYFSFADDGIL